MNSNMQKFLNEFTLIDFLSMWLPGAVCLLTWNYYFDGVAEPITRLFGEQDFALVVYFVACSYLIGTLFQEISQPIKKQIDKTEEVIDYINKIKKNKSIQNAYNKLSLSKYGKLSLSNQVQENKASNGLGQDEMVRSIYLYTNYKKVAGSKQTLYHSFYSLARNSICADLFICLVHCLNLIVKAQIEPSQFIVPVLCLLLLLIIINRCIRFRCSFLESIYCDFLILYEDQKRRNNLH